MNDTMGIIPVNYDNDEITVLGRDLHAVLEIETKYTDWFKRMCEYGFEEGIDYVKFLTKKLKNESNQVSKETPDNDQFYLNFSENGSMEETIDSVENLEEIQFPKLEKLDSSQTFKIKSPINHQLKLDMAKEIAMIQRSEIGRKVRKYFIEVEKQYKEQNKSFGEIPMSNNPKNLALIDAGQQAIVLNQYFGVNLGIARAHAINQAEKDYRIDLSEIKKLLPAVEDTPVDYTPTQIAEYLAEKYQEKFTARQVNNLLRDFNFQYKDPSGWKLTYEGKDYGTSYPYERNGHTGFQIKWKPSVLKFLERHLDFE